MSQVTFPCVSKYITWAPKSNWSKHMEDLESCENAYNGEKTIFSKYMFKTKKEKNKESGEKQIYRQIDILSAIIGQLRNVSTSVYVVIFADMKTIFNLS